MERSAPKWGLIGQGLRSHRRVGHPGHHQGDRLPGGHRRTDRDGDHVPPGGQGGAAVNGRGRAVGAVGHGIVRGDGREHRPRRRHQGDAALVGGQAALGTGAEPDRVGHLGSQGGVRGEAHRGRDHPGRPAQAVRGDAGGHRVGGRLYGQVPGTRRRVGHAGHDQGHLLAGGHGRHEGDGHHGSPGRHLRGAGNGRGRLGGDIGDGIVGPEAGEDRPRRGHEGDGALAGHQAALGTGAEPDRVGHLGSPGGAGGQAQRRGDHGGGRHQAVGRGGHGAGTGGGGDGKVPFPRRGVGHAGHDQRDPLAGGNGGADGDGGDRPPGRHRRVTRDGRGGRGAGADDRIIRVVAGEHRPRRRHQGDGPLIGSQRAPGAGSETDVVGDLGGQAGVGGQAHRRVANPGGRWRQGPAAAGGRAAAAIMTAAAVARRSSEPMEGKT